MDPKDNALKDLAPLVVLASASPRRQELLWQIGVPHRAEVADIDERRLDGEAPVICVRRLALAKARKIWLATSKVLPVLGADTVVVIDEDMLGKPADRSAAVAMLKKLSGRTHRVLTAVALIGRELAGDEFEQVAVSASEVCFRVLDPLECARYWDSGEPCDKAGGYAIQGLGAVFVSELRGSYSGVMGMPLFETAALLDAAGLTRRSAGGHRPDAGEY